MSLSAAISDRVPVHARAISFKGYRRGDGLWDVEGHLVDTCQHEAAWPGGGRAAHEPIHSMRLRVTVDHTGLIKQAEAVTEASPYAGVCGGVARRYAELAGIQVGPGFRRRVLQIVGSLNGCTHMIELLLGIGTAVLQTLAGEVPVPQGQKPFSLDGCHALDTSGQVVKAHYPLWYRPRSDGGPVAGQP